MIIDQFPLVRYDDDDGDAGAGADTTNDQSRSSGPQEMMVSSPYVTERNWSKRCMLAPDNGFGIIVCSLQLLPHDDT
jgi:hypothetical protein